VSLWVKDEAVADRVQRAQRRRIGADPADDDVFVAKIWYGGDKLGVGWMVLVATMVCRE